MEDKKKTYDQQAQYQALQDTLSVIGGKWTIPVINSVCNGNRRFKEIEKSLPGITKRMLSKSLKEVEVNQVLNRTVRPTTPVLIEYQLTDYCRSFGPIIREMINWGILHREKITKS